MRVASRALAPLAAALALLAAGCVGGGVEADVTTAPAPPPEPPPVAVRVVDGDTGRPVPGAVVRGRGGDGPATARTDAAGRAELPAGTRTVDVRPQRHEPARRAVRGRGVRVRVYDPRLQSPEYGGGPSRSRHVPAVRVGPPRGEPDWSFDGRTLIEFPPAVRNGLVVFGTNAGRVFALDADDGSVRWARRVRGQIASAPAIAGGRVYVTSMAGLLTVFRESDGRKIWEFSTGGSPIESSPLVVDGIVYFGAWNGTFYAVDVETRRARWTYRAAADIKGGAAQAGDLVLVGDYAGNLHALHRRTGARRWVYTGGQRFYGGPAVSGRTAVIGDVGGAVIAVDTRTGAARWRHATGAWVYSTPAIAGGRVFVGSYSGAFQALDLATGAVRWSFDAGGRISGSATVVGDVVYTSILYRPGQPRRTYGLDVRDGSVGWRLGDGRYSPAVGAGSTLYIVGTRMLYAYRSPPT